MRVSTRRFCKSRYDAIAFTEERSSRWSASRWWIPFANTGRNLTAAGGRASLRGSPAVCSGCTTGGYYGCRWGQHGEASSRETVRLSAQVSLGGRQRRRQAGDLERPRGRRRGVAVLQWQRYVVYLLEFFLYLLRLSWAFDKLIYWIEKKERLV